MAIVAAKDQFHSYGILEIFQSNWQSNIFFPMHNDNNSAQAELWKSTV